MQSLAKIENMKCATVEGASSVIGFDSKGVYFLMEEERGEILGKGLEITTFDNEKKYLVVEGEIYSIAFKGKKESMVKKIFK